MNALIVDYFGTIANPPKVDGLLGPLATKGGFGGIYDEGAKKALEMMIQGDKRVITAVRDTFYPDVARLFETAQRAGLDTGVYSRGHGPFIIKGLRLLGVKTKFVDPDEIGDKNEPGSYRNIREKGGYQTIIFATDSGTEARAAMDGGIDHVVLVYIGGPDYSILFDLIKGIP